MANLKTVLEIGGKIGESFKGAFSSVDSRFKSLGKSVKDFNSQAKDIELLGKMEAGLVKSRRLVNEARKSGNADDLKKYQAHFEKNTQKADELRSKLKALGVDTKNLSGEMERLSKQSENAGKKLDLLKKKSDLGSAFKNAATSIATTGAVIGGAIAAAGGSALALGQNVSNFIDDAKDASDGLGIDSVNNLLALQYAFADVGLQAEETNALIAKFNSKIEESKDPASGAAKSLAQLGLTFKDFEGRSPEVQFQILAGAIKNAPEGLNKTAFAMELLGKKGFKALAKLKEGAGFFDDAKEAAKEAGFLITEDMEKMADKNQKAFAKMQLGFRSAMNTVGSAYLPVLTNTFGIITKFLGDHKEELMEIGSRISRALDQALPTIITFGTLLIGTLTTLFKSVDGLVQIFGGWGTVMELLGVYMGAVFVTKALGVVSALFSIGKAAWAVMAGIGGISGAWSAFTALVIANPIGAAIAGITLLIYLLYKNFQPVRDVIDYIWEKLKLLGSAIGNFFSGGSVSKNISNELELSASKNSFKAPELRGTSSKQTNINNSPTINVQVATNADPHAIGQEVSRSFQSGLLNTGSLNA